MADTRLPLMTQALDTATPVRQMHQDQQQNTMNHEQILSQYYDNLDSREKSRLSSVISGAVQLEPFLDNGDLDGAHDFLMRRRNSIQQRMGSGENIDTEDTDAAIQMLRTGNVDELKNTIKGLKQAGQVYGILNRTDAPSNVQEWQYYNSLSPEDQEKYLTMKRSNQVVNLGGQQIVPSQVNPAGAPQASYGVTPKPEEMPDFKRDQAQATAEGTAAGTRNANREQKAVEAETAIGLLNEAKAILPKATGSGVGSVIATGKGLAGLSDESTQANSQLELLAGWLTSNVPRMQGPQSNFDVQNYQKMAADLGNRTKPVEDRMAAADTLIALHQKYANNPQGTGAGGGAATGQKVRVTDGQKVYEIDASDLQEALQDGMRQL